MAWASACGTVDRWTRGGGSENSDLKRTACNMFSLCARRGCEGVAFAAPAGVNPLNPMLDPLSISSAASSADRIGNCVKCSYS